MPELDGFGVLTALKARPELKFPPTLMLTARHAPDDVRRAVGLGAKDYLTKPFSESQLLARVARLLRRPIPPAPQAPDADSIMIEALGNVRRSRAFGRPEARCDCRFKPI